MAIARLALSTVRRMIPLYIRHNYTPTAALRMIRSRFQLRISDKVFFDNWHEIKRSFDFSPALRELGADTLVPRQYVVRSAHPIPQRYEYTLRFLGRDPLTAEPFTRYATVYSKDRLTAHQAVELLKQQQAAGQFTRRRRGTKDPEQLEAEQPYSEVHFYSVKDAPVR